MANFGENLRKEREARGIKLQEITAATKISPRHLEALEHDQFKLLPGGVFNKGIVRSYARVVGLDEEVWVSRFMDAYKASNDLLDDDKSWMEFAQNVSMARKAGRDRGMIRLRWAGVLLLLAILGIVTYFVSGYIRRRAGDDSARRVSPSTISKLQIEHFPARLRPAA